MLAMWLKNNVNNGIAAVKTPFQWNFDIQQKFYVIDVEKTNLFSNWRWEKQLFMDK